MRFHSLDSSPFCGNEAARTARICLLPTQPVRCHWEGHPTLSTRNLRLTRSQRRDQGHLLLPQSWCFCVPWWDNRPFNFALPDLSVSGITCTFIIFILCTSTGVADRATHISHFYYVTCSESDSCLDFPYLLQLLMCHNICNNDVVGLRSAL